MHIILLPLLWTHLISASSFTLKPQVRHILYIQPKLTSPWSVKKLQCATLERLWEFGRCFLEKISQVSQ